MKDLSIIIVSYNTKKLLLECIDSIKKHTKSIDFEIIVVDNASSDGSPEAVGKIKGVTLYKNSKNLGFAKANNQGIKKAQGKYVLLLNSDTLLSDNSLKEIVLFLEDNRKAGIATCALKNKDGSLQGTGGYFPTLLGVFSWMTIQDIPGVDNFIKPFHPMRAKSFAKGASFYQKVRQLDWVTGAFFLVRKEVFDQVGLFDENYFMYVEEVDFCFRAKAKGWQVWYLPRCNILHYGGASGTQELSVIAEYEGIKRFYKKFYPSWQYPVLRFLLKIGALGRIVLFGLVEGKGAAKTYAQAFRKA